MRQKALPLAQNKIDYIVFHNPEKVTELLYNQGFDPPTHPKELAEAIKELTRKKGRQFLEQLVKLHPDKEVILSLEKTDTTTSCGACKNNLYDSKANYCKGCGHSNYLGSGDEDSFLGQFDSYQDVELEKYYKGIVHKSNENPTDKNLAQEVQMIWNEIRLRKDKHKEANQAKEVSKKQFIGRDELMLIGVVFFAGALVGHGLKFNFNNG